jgi:3D (Asp-Asp-Asp) domain-containing protein
MYNRDAVIAMLVTCGIIGPMIFRNNQTIFVQSAEIQELRQKNAIALQQNKNMQTELKSKDAQIQSLNTALSLVQKDDTWHMVNGIATAYSPHDNKSGIEAGSTPDTTSIGLHPGNGIIAVDPSKIPYRSEMLVIYPDGHTYQGIAGDTGGALRASRGVHIDIYKDTYAETEQYGVKNVIILWRQAKGTS